MRVLREAADLASGGSIRAPGRSPDSLDGDAHGFRRALARLARASEARVEAFGVRTHRHKCAFKGEKHGLQLP